MLMRMQSDRDSHSLLAGICNCTATLEDSLEVSYKTILLSYNTAVVLIGISPKKVKTYVHTKTFTLMFKAVLLIIAKALKQSRCPSVGKQINCSISRQWNIILH